jgi:Phytanoyl-CoA dioxygenase (PhyH)
MLGYANSAAVIPIQETYTMRYLGLALRVLPDIQCVLKELSHVQNNPGQVNSQKSYVIMRRLYGISGGYLFTLLNKYISIRSASKSKFPGGLKKLPAQDPHVLHQLIEMDCYSIEDPSQTGKIGEFVNTNMGRIEISENDIFANKEIAALVTKEVWVNEARSVIGTEPVAIGLSGWWSKPTTKDNSALSKAAQLWHRDLDRVRDIKFFFYATDVNADNGPFEYIADSHLPSHRAFSLNDGRFDDSWVQSRYPKGAVSMVGKAGDVFMVDTQGIHRGRPVERGLRCVLQLYFSSSTFGAEFQYQPRIRLDKRWPSYSVWEAAIKREPKVWKTLFGATSAQ